MPRWRSFSSTNGRFSRTKFRSSMGSNTLSEKRVGMHAADQARNTKFIHHKGHEVHTKENLFHISLVFPSGMPCAGNAWVR